MENNQVTPSVVNDVIYINDVISQTSRVCEFWEIAYSCGISHDELLAIKDLEDLNLPGPFSFSYQPKYN